MGKRFLLGLTVLLCWLLTSCSDSEFSAQNCGDEGCDVTAQNFSWDYGDWSRCSLACNGGTRTRNVVCRDINKTPVLDSECSGVEPIREESCNTHRCVADYNWNSGPWSQCTKSCGGGQKHRVVTCQSEDGDFVEDSNCQEAKPASTLACNVHDCPNNYRWVPGNWGTCSKPCNDGSGPGSWSRTVTCQNAQDVIVDDSHCVGQDKPTTTGACNTQSCDYNYSWVEGQWNACSRSCYDGVTYGTQTRSLGCMRDDGVYVPHTLCPQPTPQTQRNCNTQACGPSCNQKQINVSVGAAENQLDILLVVDDSGSMYVDSSRLATKLSGFVNQLQSSNINWQMCVTSTDVDYYQGRPIQWVGGNSGHILTKNSGSLSNIFVDTMRFIGAGFSPDEQAIKAMNLSVQDNQRSGCYRAQAGLAVIVISDEDERSVGGNQALHPIQYKPLGALNTPQSFINTINSSFPAGKRVVVNSFIVKDATCKAEQDAQGGADVVSFYGTKYQELSNMTGGVVESICARDYTVGLNNMHTCIRQKLGSIRLQCVPTKSPDVFVNGSDYSGNSSMSGNELHFNPVIQGPANVTGQYCCP